MNVLPRDVLVAQRTQHDPRSSTTANGYHELTASSDRGSGFCGNKLRRRAGRGFVIGKNFNLHRGLSASEIHAAWPAMAEVSCATTGFCQPPGGETRSLSFGPHAFGSARETRV